MSARRGHLIRLSRGAATLAALAVWRAGPAGAQTPPPPALAHADGSVAVTDDASAFGLNPAALGVRYPSELLFGVVHEEPNRLLWHGAGVAGPIGLRALYPERGRLTWGLSLAGGSDALRLGAGWSSLAADGTPGLPGAVVHARTRDLDLGVLSRPTPWLSLGAVARHATQPRLGPRLLERAYALGIGVRPLALRGGVAKDGARLTLSADVEIPEGDADRARTRFGAAAEVVRGILLRGSVGERGAFRLGLSLLQPRAALHGAVAFDESGERTRSAAAVSFHEAEDRTALALPSERAIALVRVGGPLGDEAISGFTLLDGPVREIPSEPIHRQLERALEDPLVRGVLLQIGGVSNMAQLEELRPRIRRLRAANKPVVAYLETGGNRGALYLASACDLIYTTREANYWALGLMAERRYYRRMLAELGVRIDRADHGVHKSAFRGYSADSTPAPDRAAIEHNLDVVQELFVSAVAADRGIPRERLLTALDGRSWPARDLAALGVVDSIGYREDALRALGERAGLGGRPRARELAGAEWARVDWTTPARIAVVYASGSIETGGSGNDLFLGPYMGSSTMVRQLERAFRNPAVDAVVLRIESGGGSSVGSDLIYHAVERWKRETRKPLIVSMGSLAASGGYQIALPADRIYADRFTRTGSIGVFYVRPSFEGFFSKHHVHQELYLRGPYMRGWSIGKDWDAEIQAAADSAATDSYRGFIADVARHRGKTLDEIDAVAQGRVWLGDDALARGLVDAIGGLEEAIAEAGRRAGIRDATEMPTIDYRRPRPGLLEGLIGRMVGSAWERSLRMPEPGAVLRIAGDELP